MSQTAQETITRPGITVAVRGSTTRPDWVIEATPTVATGLVPFDAVKHLLTDEPLPRPNRAHPRAN
jgi:hypothetical protein